MLQATHRTAGNVVFNQRMIGNDRKAVIFFLHPANKARQEWLNQRLRLGDFAVFIGLQRSDNAVARHHFFHLRRRNKVAFLRIDF